MLIGSPDEAIETPRPASSLFVSMAMRIRGSRRSEIGQKRRKVFHLVGCDRSWRVAQLSPDFPDTLRVHSSASRVAPDDLNDANDNGERSVDGPLVVVHHEAHRTTRHSRRVEGDVKRLQNPRNTKAKDHQAQSCTDDPPDHVENDRHHR
jgi:hypothetical protein